MHRPMAGPKMSKPGASRRAPKPLAKGHAHLPHREPRPPNERLVKHEGPPERPAQATAMDDRNLLTEDLLPLAVTFGEAERHVGVQFRHELRDKIRRWAWQRLRDSTVVVRRIGACLAVEPAQDHLTPMNEANLRVVALRLSDSIHKPPPAHLCIPGHVIATVAISSVPGASPRLCSRALAMIDPTSQKGVLGVV